MCGQTKGFTLIELMVTVAILGILAAIALPTYNFYVAKSQAAEAIILLDAARTNTEDIITLTGQFPQNQMALISLNTQTIGKFGTITGTANTANNSSSGDIVFLFSSNTNTILREKAVWYNRDSLGNWTCKTNIQHNILEKFCSFENSAPTGS